MAFTCVIKPEPLPVLRLIPGVDVQQYIVVEHILPHGGGGHSRYPGTGREAR